MFRSLKLSTFPALAMAMILPIAASAAQGTTAAKSAAATNTKTAMHHHDATTPAKTTASHRAHMSRARRPAVDINTASKEELMTLPGITEQIAEKIIQDRPFKTKSELVSKQVITRSEYTKLRGRVTTTPESKAAQGKAPETNATESK